MTTTDYAKALRTASLKTVEAAHADKIAGRSKLRLDIEEMLRDRLIDLELKESRAANEALAAGASKTAVGRAMGTANWQTIEAVLARTAGDVPTEKRVIDPLDERYSFDAEGKTLTVTLDDETLAAMVDAWGDWDEWSAKHAGIDRETFTVTPGVDGRPVFTSTSARLIDGLKWHLTIKWMDEVANDNQAREYVEAHGWVNGK
jgi:hypothetical protein